MKTNEHLRGKGKRVEASVKSFCQDDQLYRRSVVIRFINNNKIKSRMINDTEEKIIKIIEKRIQDKYTKTGFYFVINVNGFINMT